MGLIEIGIQKGFIKLDEESRYVTYIHHNKKINFQNPSSSTRKAKRNSRTYKRLTKQSQTLAGRSKAGNGKCETGD